MISSKTNERVRLADAFWFQEGPGVRNWQFTPSGIKLLNVGNITASGEIDLSKTDRHLSVEEVEQKYSHFLVDEGDLVIASSGISFDSDGLLRTRGGFVRKEHLPLCMNTSTIRFRPHDIGSDINFFKFWLDSYEFRHQITTLVTGSAQQNFGPSHLRQLKITLPPLAEQQRIADILSRADRVRRLRRFALEMSEGYLQAVFLEMFGEQLRNASQSTEMGKLVTITGGGTPSRDIERYYTGDIPWLTSKDMRGDYIWDTQEHITKEAIAKSATKLVPAGSILVVVKSKILMRRLPLALTMRPMCHGQDIKSIQCSDRIDPIFLIQVMKYNEDKLLAKARGANTEGLNLPMLREIPVPDVPLSDQKKFVRVVEGFRHLRAQQREALRQAEHLFQGLLQSAFRGELTPPPRQAQDDA